MMLCFGCGSDDSFVIDTRATEIVVGVKMIRRRRECKKCISRFTTYEIPSQMLAEINTLVLLLGGVRDSADNIVKNLTAWSEVFGEIECEESAGAEIVRAISGQK